MFKTRPTYAQIDLDALRFNLRSSREFIGPDLKYMAVVKANAYGHGAVECSKALIEEGIDWLGVALLEEAIELRRAGIEVPVLCLGGLFSGQEGSCLEHDVTPVILNLKQADALCHAAEKYGIRAAVHIKVDTGMGRLGIRWDQLDPFITELAKMTNLRVQGLMTHFAAADDPAENEFTELQIDRFFQSVEHFEAAGIIPEIIDLANSPGAIAHARSRTQMVRLGGILYGLAGDILPSGIPRPKLKRVMSLISAIADIKQVRKGETVGYGRTFKTSRDSLVALVPIGYNDGYSRGLSNAANVIIRDRCVPVVGRISMDWTIVDVTELNDPAIGDEVVLIGSAGGFEINAEDLAKKTGTISYEITCGIGHRVPRRYIHTS